MELSQTRTPAATPSTPLNASPPRSSAESESESLSALACSCLLSLVVARGDTGKLLTAIAAMLMFSARLATQDIKVVLPFGITKKYI
jgi:hypothetical protein